MKTYSSEELKDCLDPEDIPKVIAAQTILNAIGMEYDPTWDGETGFGFYWQMGDITETVGMDCQPYFAWFPLREIRHASPAEILPLALKKIMRNAFEVGQEDIRSQFRKLLENKSSK